MATGIATLRNGHTLLIRDSLLTKVRTTNPTSEGVYGNHSNLRNICGSVARPDRETLEVCNHRALCQHCVAWCSHSSREYLYMHMHMCMYQTCACTVLTIVMQLTCTCMSLGRMDDHIRETPPTQRSKGILHRWRPLAYMYWGGPGRMSLVHATCMYHHSCAHDMGLQNQLSYMYVWYRHMWYTCSGYRYKISSMHNHTCRHTCTSTYMCTHTHTP